MPRVAAVQMASGPNVGANLGEADKLAGRAAAQGAKLVVLPENFALMGMSEYDKVKAREAEGRGPIQEFMSQTAARHGIWLVGGTLPLESANPQKVRAACLVYDPAGNQVARYDKMHLFDVTVESSGEVYAESSTIEPGDRPVVFDTAPFGKIGLAVCYDLRFPELFRSLLDRGAELIAVPSAFTAVTGRAHWEVLVRARAIENLCYVVAAAQGGYHINGRETHGDSMIVDPWGTVLDRLSRGSGVVVADFDRARTASIRHNFPTVKHRRIVC